MLYCNKDFMSVLNKPLFDSPTTEDDAGRWSPSMDVTMSPSPSPGSLVNDTNLVIPQFHPNLIAPRADTYKNRDQGGSKIALIGMPNSGKSNMIKYIMHSKRNIIPVAMIMSGTESCTGYYASMVPSAFIYNEYDQMALENFRDRQKVVRQTCSNPWAMLVIDDCTTAHRNFNNPVQQDLFKNGRHYKMLYLIGAQYPKDIPVTARACFDGVFLFGTGNSDIMKRLYEFAGNFPDKETFFKVFTEVTSHDHRALYINYQNRNGKWYENIYWAQAPAPQKIPPFRFGCEEYWEVSKSRVDPRLLKEQCPYSISASSEDDEASSKRSLFSLRRKDNDIDDDKSATPHP